MKISYTPTLITNFKQKQITQNQNEQTVNQQEKAPQERKIFAYRDYNVSFGARLNRTPENFQEFNSKTMPTQMKEYLLEDFDTRKFIHPAELQRQAYQWLEGCDTVDEVKAMYPNEPLFEGLKSINDTKAKRGYLFDLRIMNDGSEPIIKNSPKEDLSVYLLKKIYLEGKTLDEINKDFDKDVNPVYRTDKYFNYSTLKSLGVEFPNIAYWQSFQATREDKSYTKQTRKHNYFEAIEAEVTKNRAPLSQETKDKISEASKKWWQSLDPEQKAEQIKKMMEGKELSNSIYSKFQGQIMTIAAHKIGFSERLAQIFSERLNDEEFNQDFDNFAQKQKAIMTEFWNKDESFRDAYSKALNETIEAFEKAYEKKDETDDFEKLLSLALDFKKETIDNAKLRKAEKAKTASTENKNDVNNVENKKNTNALDITFDSSSKTSMRKALKQILSKQLEDCCTDFSNRIANYVVNSSQLSAQELHLILLIETNSDELAFVDQDKLDEVNKYLAEKVLLLNNEFDEKYRPYSKANETAMNQKLYELTGDIDVLKNTRADSIQLLNENKDLRSKFVQQKSDVEKNYKDFINPIKDEKLKKFRNEKFLQEMIKIQRFGFKFHDDIQLDVAQKMTTHTLASLKMKNKAEEKFLMEFLRNNKGSIKQIENSDAPSIVKEFLLEHMVYDFICEKGTFIYKQDHMNQQ